MSFDAKYIDWNQKRIKGILDFYGSKFFFYKKILDLGSGHGDISAVFHRLGAEVLAVDARDNHLSMIKKKYPGIKTLKFDLDQKLPFKPKSYDLVLDLGLLCHLFNYEQHLRDVCLATTHLVLETAVCDSNDPNKSVSVPEDKHAQDLSFNGMGSRPTVANIEKILKECDMEFVRQDSFKYNSNKYVYNWTEKNSNDFSLNNRRIWFCVKASTNIKLTQANQKPIVSNQPDQNNKANVEKLNPIVQVKIEKQIKPNVAICLSGHLRTFDRTHKALQERLIKPLDADVFIHTWDTIGSENSKAGSDLNTTRVSTKTRLIDINKYYNPKKIKIEKFKKSFFFNMTDSIKVPDNEKMFVVRHLGYHFSMFYSIFHSNELRKEFEKESGKKYDYIIRCRPDMFLHSSIGNHILPENTNTIVVPNIAQYCPEGMNDQFAIGSSEAMEKYFSLYDSLYNYCNQHVTTIRPEALLKYHIDLFGLQICKSNIDYNIIRANGDIVRQT